MPGLSKTDHGRVGLINDFYRLCKENDINPIIGCEFYVAHGNYEDKTPENKDLWHITVIVKNNVGLVNLYHLSYLMNKNGFYYKPRIDDDLLFKYKEGLICLSGCAGSEINSHLRNDEGYEYNFDKAVEVAKRFKKEFGDDYYLELQDHPLRSTGKMWPVQDKINKDLTKISKLLGIKRVLTADCHYVNPEDEEAHEVLLCIGTGHYLSDADRMSLSEFDLSLKDPKVLYERWKDDLEPLQNTLEINNKVHIEFNLEEQIPPEFPTPNGYSHKQYLKLLTYRGAVKRFHNEEDDFTISQCIEKLLQFKGTFHDKEFKGEDIISALEMELSVINKLELNTYFLVVQEYINWSNDNGIRTGPGRGSSCSSLVCYCLNITRINPLGDSNLMFSRFLNSGRLQIADIDSDFEARGRQRVIQHLRDLYGEEHVAGIGVQSTMRSKNAVRDVARVLEYPFDKSLELTKLLPDAEHTGAPKLHEYIMSDEELKKLYNDSEKTCETPEFRDRYLHEPEVKKIVDLAIKLEGKQRNHGVHACATIIGAKPIWYFFPTEISNDTIATTVPMHDVEEGGVNGGLWKMDILGLSTLDLISDVINFIKQTKNQEINIDEIDLEDYKTLKSLREGTCKDIFTFSGPGMQQTLQKMKVDKFSELVMVNAMYRPGAMDYIDDIVAVKEGKKQPIYYIKGSEKFIKETGGVICLPKNSKIIDYDTGNFVNIQDAYKGMRIKSLNEKTSKFEIDVIDNVWNTGKKECISIKMNDNKKILTSKTHQFLTLNGYKEAQDIKVGDYIAQAASCQFDTDNENISQELCYFVGCMLGDGVITQGECSLSNIDEDLRNRISEIVKDNFDKEKIDKVFSKDGKCIGLTFRKLDKYNKTYKNQVGEFFKNLGYSKERMYTKEIKPIFFELSEKCRLNLLAGLWDTDGCCSQNGIHYTTTSAKLGKGVEKLLQTCGIPYRKTEENYVNKFKKQCILCRIYPNVRRFSQTIQPLLVIKRKRDAKLRCYISRRHDKLYFETVRQIAIEENIDLTHRKNAQFCQRFYERNIGTKKHYIENVKPEVIWRIVESVDEIGEKDCYDISVRKNHNFVVNSYVSHNCFQEQGMRIAEMIGFTPAETDNMRKALAKKNKAFLDNIFPTFKEKALKCGNTEENINKYWESLLGFSRYSFNYCLSGDTRLMRKGLQKDQFNPTLEEFYKIQHDKEYAKKTGHFDLHGKYNLGKLGNVQSLYADNRCRPNKLIHIEQTGIQQLYELELEDGRTIKCTAQHTFPTLHNGICELLELTEQDYIFTYGEYDKHTKLFKIPHEDYCKNLPKKGERNYQNIKKGNLFGTYNGFQNTGNKYANWIELKDQCKFLKVPCNNCGKEWSPKQKFELHHIDGNHENDDKRNLKWLCNSCHKKAHYQLGRVKVGEKGSLALPVKVKKITKLGKEMTYSVKVDDPAHNFAIENGIITGNSHAYAYAVVGYQTAWLRTHYPVEYYAAYFNHVSGDKEKLGKAIKHAKLMGIKVLPPSLNHSQSGFTPDKDGNIYYGFSAIKGIGKTGELIVERRQNRIINTVKDFFDIFSDISSSKMKALAEAGVFDEVLKTDPFIKKRYILLYNWDEIYKKYKPGKVSSKQVSLFDVSPQLNIIDPPNKEELFINTLFREKELMGDFVSANPLELTKMKTDSKTYDLIHHPYKIGHQKLSCIITGIITRIHKIRTKKGEQMAFLSLEGEDGDFECTIFPKLLSENSWLKEGKIVGIEGTISNYKSDLDYSLIANKIIEQLKH